MPNVNFSEVAKSLKIGQTAWYLDDNVINGLMFTIPEAKTNLEQLRKAADKLVKDYKLKPKDVYWNAPSQEGKDVEYIAEAVGASYRSKLKTISDAAPLAESNSAKSYLSRIKDEILDKVSSIEEAVENIKDFVKANPLPIELKDKFKDINEDFVDSLLTELTKDLVKTNSYIGEMISPQRAIAIYDDLIPKTPLQFIKNIFNFGKKKRSELFKIVDYNRMQHELGKDNWGLYKNGIVYVVTDEDGKVGTRVVRHEIFHKIFNEYLTSNERKRALELAKQKFGNLSLIQLEEELADEFSNYKKTNRTLLQSIKDIFDKLLRLIGFTFNTFNSLEELFNSIELNKFNRKISSPAVERNLIQVQKYWVPPVGVEVNSIDLYTKAQRFVLDSFNQIFKDSRSREDKRILTFDECIDEVFKIVDRTLATISTKNISEEEKLIWEATLLPLTQDKVKNIFINEYFSNAKIVDMLRSQLQDMKSRQASLEDSLMEANLELETLNEEDLESRASIIDSIENIDQELEELSTKVDVAQETFDHELQDPKSKLTGRVKQRLVSISYLDKNVNKLADFASLFPLLTNALNGLDNLEMSIILSNIEKRLGNFKFTQKNLQTSVGKAVAKFFFDFKNEWENNYKKTPKYISFKKDVQYAGEYLIVDTEGASEGKTAMSITLSEAKNNPRYLIIDRNASSQTMNQFCVSVSDDPSITAGGKVITMEELRTSYALFEDSNFINSLISTVGSLRVSKPVAFQYDTANGIHRKRILRLDSSSGRGVFENDIINAFSNYVETNKNGSLLPTSIYESAKQAKTSEEKLNSISEFLRLIKTKKVTLDANSISKEDANNMHIYYLGFLDRLKSYKQELTEEEEERYPDALYRTGAIVLDNERSFLNDLVEALNNTTSISESTSYTRGDRKTAYKFIDASFQSALLASINAAVSSKAGITKSGIVTFDHVKPSINGKWTSEVDLYKNNIFVKDGPAQVHSYFDYDSMRKKGGERWAVYLRKEGRKEQHFRNIFYGWMNHLHDTAGSRYLQFLPIPSNRTSIQAVELTALDEANAIKMAEQTLLAELSRPTPSSRPELANNSNYVKNW